MRTFYPIIYILSIGFLILSYIYLYEFGLTNKLVAGAAQLPTLSNVKRYIYNPSISGIFSYNEVRKNLPGE
jgi:hypothetical protein